MVEKFKAVAANNSTYRLEIVKMQISSKQLKELHEQLQSDRKSCANSPLAQTYLDSAEAIANGLVSDLAEQSPEELLGIADEFVGRIGVDDFTEEELTNVAADLFRWQEMIDNVAPAEQETISYQVAMECLRILKKNYVALYLKNELMTLPAERTSQAV
jgi:hypothetical protein